jgi:hypothetical protein
MKTLLFRPLCMVVFLLGMQGTALAQSDTTRLAKPTLAFTGFVDVFYAYDSHRPQGDARQPFLYNHNRHNRFDLNLGLVRLKLNHAKVRATVALHAGTYVNDNYAAEPEVLRHVAEANVGVALAGKGRLWLDVGIMPSHIGFESAISVDNQTLTRSLLAENSPYYLAAAKFTYTLHKKWEVAALVCNGWQRIRPVVGNSLPGFGTQVVWKPKAGLSLNWSTFIGTDDPDTTRRVRFFNNLYAQWQAHKNVGVTVGLDIGMQQQTKGSVQQDVWFSPVVIARWAMHPKWAAAMRAEYYHDGAGVIIAAPTLAGFRTGGLSVNVDHTPVPFMHFRVEGRWLGSPDANFIGESGAERNVFSVVVSLAIKLEQ